MVLGPEESLRVTFRLQFDGSPPKSCCVVRLTDHGGWEPLGVFSLCLLGFVGLLAVDLMTAQIVLQTCFLASICLRVFVYFLVSEEIDHYWKYVLFFPGGGKALGFLAYPGVPSWCA